MVPASSKATEESATRQARGPLVGRVWPLIRRRPLVWAFGGLFFLLGGAGLAWALARATADGGQLPARAWPAPLPPTALPGGAQLGRSARNDISPPLRTLPPYPRPGSRQPDVGVGGDFLPLPGHQDAADAVIQRDLQPPSTTRAGFSTTTGWEGLNYETTDCRCTPPNPAGAVGPRHYIQVAMYAFQVWDKQGHSLYGPVPFNTLWTGFGGACEARPEGEYAVLYDQFADRWLLAQATFVAPYSECIAVSTSGDPLGTWARYAFPLDATRFFDLPRFGLWPDGYYLSASVYDPSAQPTQAYQGPAAAVFDRAGMLAGVPVNYLVFPPLGHAVGALLPATLDGRTLPPAGAPELFATLGSGLELYRLHADWSAPAQSTFTATARLPVAPFTQLCPGTRECIPQPDAEDSNLDGLGDRLLPRLAYRNLGDHAALVALHAVDAGGGQAALRWYEVRDPLGSPSIDQQGTYAPDGAGRWLGSAALDAAGNLAIAYSIASTSTKPSLRFAGRLAADPPGILGAGEETLQAGTGVQNSAGHFWGTSSVLDVDPADDCTFWFTGEYYGTAGLDAWQSRIGSFKFPSCAATVPLPTPALPTPPAGAPSSPTPAVAPTWGCGPAWQLVDFPRPSAQVEFRALSARTAGDIWAVGDLLRPERANYGVYKPQTFVEHWDGTNWQVFPAPNDPNGGASMFSGVAAVTVEDVWAVGAAGSVPLIAHWDGRAWSASTVLDGAPVSWPLAGVTAASAQDLWAVGSYHQDGLDHSFILHGDGTRWRLVHSPQPGFSSRLAAVTARAPDDVWAVGTYGQDGADQPLLLHWDGSAWRQVANPLAVAGTLHAVVAPAADDAWAAGESATGPLFLHWDGSAWGTAPGPSGPTRPLTIAGLAARSADDVWAAGWYRAPASPATLLLHWDGTRWAVVPSPNQSTSYRPEDPTNQLHALVATASDVWAAGAQVFARYGERTAAACLTPAPRLPDLALPSLTPTTAWTAVPTDTPYPTDTPLPTDTDLPTVTAAPAVTGTPPTPACGPAWQIVTGPPIGGQSQALRGLAVLAANDIWAVGAIQDATPDDYRGPQIRPRPLIAHWDGQRWAKVSGPDPGRRAGGLLAVAAAAPDDVWAVGGADEAPPLLLHWDGSAWTPFPAPVPEGVLFGVTALAPDDVWAAGSTFATLGTALVLHWDGRAWTSVPLPPLGQRSTLRGIAARTPGDIWIAGGAGENSPEHPLILHWDGKNWQQTVFSAYSAYLTSVAATGANDAWAVGAHLWDRQLRPLLLHWDGATWNTVAGPAPDARFLYVQAVTARAPAAAWVAGYYLDQHLNPVAYLLRWDGQAWSTARAPDFGAIPPALYALAAVSEHDVWAVGGTGERMGDNTAVQRVIWLRYLDPCAPPPTGEPALTGLAAPRPTPPHPPTATPAPVCAATLQVSTPAPLDSSGTIAIRGLAARSPADIWAAGNTADLFGTEQTLVTHWDGQRWTRLPSPSGAGQINRLNAVAAVADDDVWAVGASGAEMLIEHWDGRSWSVSARPDGGLANTWLNGVAARARDDAWAVGESGQGQSAPRPLMLHWTGTAWQQVALPALADGGTLRAVVALSATDVWAAGGSGPAADRPLALHWDGRFWAALPVPGDGSGGSAGPGGINALSALAADNIWAVTEAWSGSTPFLHWDGTSWRETPGANPPARDGSFTALAVQSDTDIWAAGSSVTGSELRALVDHWDGTAWTDFPQPESHPFDSGLGAVAPAGPHSAWVGAGRLTQLTWAPNPCGPPTATPTITPTPGPTATPTVACGPGWAAMSAVNPPDPENAELHGVAVVASNDVWAVGYGEPPTFVQRTVQPVIQHWDGGAWSVVPGAALSGGRLEAVTALAANDVWAVGAAGDGPLVEHWDGRAWSRVPVPAVTTPWATLFGVAAVSPRDIWAVGIYGPWMDLWRGSLILHWDGTTWQVFPPPDLQGRGNGLQAVAATGARDVWAVGTLKAAAPGGGLTNPLVLHWDGTAWQESAIPRSPPATPQPGAGAPPGGPWGGLTAVAALSPGNVWAVGYAYQQHTMMLHWDGRAWQEVTAAEPVGAFTPTDMGLTGLTARAADDIWAVGSYGDERYDSHPLIEHWDGQRWTLSTIPRFASRSYRLLAVQARTAADVWAVGTGQGPFGGEVYQTIVYHYATPCRDR